MQETVINAVSEKSDLRGADLRGANLCGADLRGADLRGAKNLTPVMLARLSILPDLGDFIAWKQCRNHIIVRVVEVIGSDVGVSDFNSNVTYRVGETVHCDHWNEDRWTECGGGIHFFITRVEAEEYSL